MLAQFGALTVAPETQFGELPWEVVALVFLRLPLDARLRAREVSRGWRALLNEPRFWLVLDFSPGSGVTARFTRALLFAAGERGRGHLHTLDLTGAEGLFNVNLAQFVAAHGQSLRSVTASGPLSADQVTRTCRSAPLCTLRCRVECTAAEAPPLLRCEAPCALLHIFKLWVGGFDNNEQVLDFAAALPSHRGKIKDLTVSMSPLENVAVADALMRSIAESRVSNLTFFTCYLAPASLPGLTRLLQADCLETLGIYNDRQVLFETGPDLTAFCHALRSSTLQALTLAWCQLWRDPAASGELMAALVGHQMLRELSLKGNNVRDMDNVLRNIGEQLALLVTQNNALQKLDFQDSPDEVALEPIFEALHFSSTLKELGIDVSEISREFARDVILPAVRANTSLRRTDFTGTGGDRLMPELIEANVIVYARRPADAGATIAA